MEYLYVLFFLFFVVLAVAIVEVVFQGTWNTTYLKHRISVFIAQIPANPDSSPPPSIEDVDAEVGGAAGGPPLVSTPSIRICMLSERSSFLFGWSGPPESCGDQLRMTTRSGRS